MAFEFHIEESKVLPGLFIITPDKFTDLRGDIWSIFSRKHLQKLLPEGLEFVLDKFTFSHFNVLRGIHGDYKSYKLVTCAHGEIMQVVVDCRKESATYLKWQKFILNSKEPKALLLPPFFGNSQYTLSKEGALYFYKWAYEGEYVDADEQFTLAYDDERIGIDWGVEKPILSDRDIEVKKGDK